LDERVYADEVARAALYYTVRKMSRGGEGQSFSHMTDRDQQLCWDNGVRALPEIARRLRGVRILHGDALELLPMLDGPETLHYLDPPYVRTARSTTPLYGPYELTDDTHRELCLLIRQLRGKVVLSGYSNPIYEEILGGWRQARRTTQIYAHFSIHGRNRGMKTEVLWLNF